MEYYHGLITQKSFDLLKSLRKSYDFILIGGWAVWFYTKALKSKDIDLVVEYDTLEKLRLVYPVVKNDRLKKYEVKLEGVDVDLYLPFYSDPGIPAQDISKFAADVEGFKLPTTEVLFILKQVAMASRLGSLKGEKDKIDLWSLIKTGVVNWQAYRELIVTYKNEELIKSLHSLLEDTKSVRGLGLHEGNIIKLKEYVKSQMSMV